MANNITLNVGVDASDAKSEMQRFGDVAQKAIQASDAKIQKMGLSLQNSVNKMEKLNGQMTELASKRVPTTEYTALQTKIKEVSSSLKQAKDSLSALEATSLHTEQYDYITQKIQDINKELQDARQNLGKSIATSGYSAETEAWTNKVADLEAKLIEAQQYQQELTEAGQKYANADEFTPKIEQVQSLEQELARLRTQEEAMKTAGTDTMSGANTARYQDLENQMALARQQSVYMANNLDTAANSASKMSSNLSKGKSWMQRVKESCSSLISSLKRVGKQSTETGKTHNTSFKKMLTTVLKYGFGIRSIFLLYKKLRTVISTGLSEMSKQFSDVADDVYTLKNSWSGFKASLVSAFQPIFSYVVPALTTLINYLTTAMNALANFFALLTGQSYYYKAKKGNESVAKSIGGTGSAAAEANEELAEYDDLIVIEQDNSSGGGSGGSGSSDSDAWNWEKVDVEANSWVDKIKSAFSNWDFTELGAELSAKLTDVLKNIPWNTIYSYASNFGKGLATFLNGLITEDLFSALGTTIGNAIKTALTFLNTFGTTFDWTNFGSSIASGINAFVQTNPLSLAVDTFNTWANGILDTLNTAVEGVGWSTIGQHIADGIGKVDAWNIGWKLGTLVDNLVNGVYDLVSIKDTWTNLGTKVADGINGFFEGFSGKDLIDTMNAIKDGLFEAISTAIRKIKWDEVGKDITDFLNGVDLGTVLLTITSVALAAATKTLLATKLPALLKSECKGIIGFNGKAVSVGTVTLSVIASLVIGWEIGTKLYESLTGEEVEQSMLEECWDILDFIGGDSGTIQSRLTGYAKQVLSPLTFPVSVGWNLFEETSLYDTLKTYLQSGVDELKANLDNLINNSSISQTVSSLWSKIKNVFTSFFSGNGTYGHGYNGMPSEVASAYESSQASSFWNDMGKNIVDGIVEGIKLSLQTNPFTAPIVALYDAIKNALADKFDSHSPAKAMYEDGENILNGIIQGFKNAITSIPTAIAEFYNNFKTKVKEKFQNFSITELLSNAGNIAITLTTTLAGGLTKLADFTGLSTFFKNVKTKWNNLKSTLKTTLSGAFSSITGSNSLTSLSSLWSGLKEKWVDKSATLKTFLGGQMSYVTDITSWTNAFSTLRSTWADKTATMKAYVGGAVNSIEDIVSNSANSWKTKFTTFVSNVWQDATATLKAEANIGGKSDNTLSNFKYGGGWYNTVTNFTSKIWTNTSALFSTTAKVGDTTNNSLSEMTSSGSSNGWYKRFTSFVNTWKQGATASFTSTFTNSDTNSQGYKNLTALRGAWNQTATATFNAKYVDADTNSAGYQAYCNLWNNWENKTATFTVAYDASAQEGITTMANTILKKIYNAMDASGIKLKQKVWAAKGGIVNYPVYAGEAGQEAIIPLERNLGWMDKMATAISDKITNTELPDVVMGKTLPSTQEFISTFNAGTKNIEYLLEEVINRLSALEDERNDMQPIQIQVDGRTVAQVVWDETEKRYKQTGVRYGY